MSDAGDEHTQGPAKRTRRGNGGGARAKEPTKTQLKEANDDLAKLCEARDGKYSHSER